MQYRIVLFQPYLRKHIINFGKYLTDFMFVIHKPSSGNFYHSQLPSSYEGEIQRVKTSKINKLRKYVGLPNVRIKFDSNADLFFTYGSLLITNKPYCTYIENSVALYNYDSEMIKHPLATFLVSFLIRRKNCKRLIFMSKAAEKGFTASVAYSKKTLSAIQKKSVQIYPLVDAKDVQPKKSSSRLRLLFTGMFYMKGGLETIHAYASLKEKYPNIELTIVTHLQTIQPSDLAYIKSMEGIIILDAKLNASEMETLYRSHDIFLLPTYRDSFGLVLIEAISYGMPIICTDQFATTEVAIDRYNAYVYRNHPLQDYDPLTFKIFGKYRNPKDFYAQLFHLQGEGRLKSVEKFLYDSIEKYIKDPSLLETFSKNSLELYRTVFHQDIITKKIENVFSSALDTTENPHLQQPQETDTREKRT